jgi:CIC family chloride channel protein
MLSRILNSRRRAVLVEFFRRLTSPEQPVVWLLALLVGILSGYAALAFYTAVSAIQGLLYGATEASIESGAAQLEWYVVLVVPILGGLIVGIILAVFSQSGRAASVAEVIESSRVRNCELSLRSGAISFIVSVVSLGFGASSGREGPVVHAGATIASQISYWLKCSPVRARTLLGCAAAAAVSSSFNAPIAGALFAMEVVLGYYAVKAFAPVVIASVAGAMISREHIGDFPAFSIPTHALETFWELPAFALLGVVCAITATLLMACIIVADNLTDNLKDRWNYPLWLEPVVGGALLGVIAIGVPQTIGVGYETTTRVLNEQYGFWFILVVIAAKLAAVAITLATRFGGGVFSPSLMLGALTGGAFGIVATSIVPDMSISYGLYALAGMGAVAAAVLGAPISTSLIVFELTGDYQSAVAVMVTVSVASVMTQQVIERSYFHWRLGNRGLHLGDGPQRYLLDTMKVGNHMAPRGSEGSPSEMQSWDLIEQGVLLMADDTLAKALPMFVEGSKLESIPVVKQTEGGGNTLVGALFHVDALRAYNRALVEAHEEEHG